MVWTAPKTWNVGELLTAANFNLHIRDNLLYLYEQASFLQLGARTTLGAAAATMGITGLDTSWEILRFLVGIRGTNAATSDTFRIRLGGAVLDTTAGNYGSYAHVVSTTTPTHTVSENLGATAGIGGSGLFMPGNTATAGYRALYEIIVFNGNVQAGLKSVLVRGQFQLNNTTGNMGIVNAGGMWLNTTNTLQQISIIGVSGSNIAADSWISAYGGNA